MFSWHLKWRTDSKMAHRRDTVHIDLSFSLSCFTLKTASTIFQRWLEQTIRFWELSSCWFKALLAQIRKYSRYGSTRFGYIAFVNDDVLGCVSYRMGFSPSLLWTRNKYMCITRIRIRSLQFSIVVVKCERNAPPQQYYSESFEELLVLFECW